VLQHTPTLKADTLSMIGFRFKYSLLRTCPAQALRRRPSISYAA